MSRTRKAPAPRTAFSRTWKTVIAFLIVAGFFALSEVLRSKVSDSGKEVLFALLVVVAVHLLDRLFLYKETAEAITEAVKDGLQESLTLISSASACSMNAIYGDRDQAKASVMAAIRNALHCVYLLGVSFTATITIEELCPILKDKLRGEKPVDVKLLLLDALRSPAVF